jgi:D-beta-D-heptose 7-phosphate kinase/D-beta-D-heptose 1-phosphate adenosyltransferase
LTDVHASGMPFRTAGEPSTGFVEAVARLEGGRVLLVGDFMLDETVRGAAERLSPDAPVPVLAVDGEDGFERRPGGAGNVAACLRGLEASVCVVGLVGDDDAGRHLSQTLAELGCDVAGLVVDPSRPTTLKRSLVGLAQHRHPQKMFRMDIERRVPASDEIVARLLEVVEARLDQVDVVCLEDYAKGACPPALCQGLIERCRARDIPVLVDPAAITDYSRYEGASAITPNRSEAELASGLRGGLRTDLRHAAEIATRLRVDHDFGSVVLTLDRDGAMLADATGCVHLPTEARSVYDVTGAGDMVLAALAAARCQGFAGVEGVRLANLAAGIEVELAGAQPVPLADLRRAALRACGAGRGKVRSREHLLLELEVHRRDGRRIVLTNGCFDVIHAGHVAYLREARRQGDLLVVGINADESIRRLKGEERPIFAEPERLEVLEELQSIDYLVVFPEDTAHDLIEAVRPDIYVKGGDYAPEEIAEHGLVTRLGIDLRVLAHRPGLGSTAIIDRLRTG